MNWPGPTCTWWMSSGRLAVELISGQLQLGPTDIEQRQPSDEAVVGDPAAVNPQAPSYRALGAVAWPLNRQRAQPARGALVTQRLDAHDVVTDDPTLRRYDVRLGARTTGGSGTTLRQCSRTGRCVTSRRRSGCH